MNDRGARRRAIREAGYRRAKGKKGRRAEMRTPRPPQEFPALDAAGFQVPLPDRYSIPEHRER